MCPSEQLCFQNASCIAPNSTDGIGRWFNCEDIVVKISFQLVFWESVMEMKCV